jgi:hypothetical protein
MSEWTPRFEGYSEGWSIYGRDEHGEYLVAEEIGSYADDEESEAQARRYAYTIAAAPTMAEALDPDTLDVAADQCQGAGLAAVATALRMVAERQRAALSLAKGEDRNG